MPRTAQEWIESFQILGKYADSSGSVGVVVEHDEMWAGPDYLLDRDGKVTVALSDIRRLTELGWQIDKEIQRLNCHVWS